jgi:hypothetical protein
MPTVNHRGLFWGLGLGRLKPKEGNGCVYFPGGR